MDKLVLCTVVMMVVVTVQGWPLSKDKEPPTVNKINAKDDKSDLEGCPKYDYCEGQSFPHRVKVKDYAITCDQQGVTPTFVRDHCCLPNSPHLVCYNIKVEGQQLNYSNETEKYLVTTDFTDLCQNMAEAEGRTPGAFNAATFEAGGGTLAFLYGEWKDVYGAEANIRHLACGVEEED